MPRMGIGVQAGDIQQADVNTGVGAPRVRSLKVSLKSQPKDLVGKRYDPVMRVFVPYVTV